MGTRTDGARMNSCFQEQNRLSNSFFEHGSKNLTHYPSRRRINRLPTQFWVDVDTFEKGIQTFGSYRSGRGFGTHYAARLRVSAPRHNLVEYESNSVNDLPSETKRFLGLCQENQVRKSRQTTNRLSSYLLRQAELKDRFIKLANQWRQETKHMSLMSDMILHPAYQQIIGMGPDAVPLILEELSREPDHWFWALRSITGDNPIQPKDRGRLKKMAEAWLGWGRQHGYKC